MSLIVLFADGGSRSNPGPAAGASILYEVNNHPKVIKSELTNLAQLDLKEVGQAYKFLGKGTNNEAEWTGLVVGLQKYLDLNLKLPLLILLDSELVTKQLLGIYKVKQPHLKPFHTHAHELLDQINDWKIEHIFRAYNKQADSLVNEVLDANT